MRFGIAVYVSLSMTRIQVSVSYFAFLFFTAIRSCNPFILMFGMFHCTLSFKVYFFASFEYYVTFFLIVFVLRDTGVVFVA